MKKFFRLANRLDTLAFKIESGLFDRLKKLMENSKLAAIKKALESISSYASKAPEKAADYLIRLEGWLDGLIKGLKQTESKKASLNRSAKLDKMNIAIVLLILNLVSSLTNTVIHVLESKNQQKQEVQKQDVRKNPKHYTEKDMNKINEAISEKHDAEAFRRGDMVKHLERVQNKTKILKYMISVGNLEIPIEYISDEESVDEDSSVQLMPKKK